MYSHSSSSEGLYTICLPVVTLSLCSTFTEFEPNSEKQFLCNSHKINGIISGIIAIHFSAFCQNIPKGPKTNQMSLEHESYALS